MSKIILFIALHIFIITSVNAKEPTLGILLNVLSNDTQKFGIGNYTFYCQPYGVVTLDKLLNSSQEGSRCKDSIEDFYKKNPDLKYFSYSVLDVKQRYHLEFKNSECIIYAKGQTTLAELLLTQGLALVDRKFKDEEFQYAYKKAEFKAKYEKKGMWEKKIHKNCVSELNK